MARRKTKKLYKKRAFLNPYDGMAAVDAKVTLSDQPTYTEVDAGLSFSDCSQTIHLDFDLWNSSVTKTYMRKRRAKLELMRKTVNDFLDKVEEAYTFAEEHAEAKKAEEKRLEQEQKKKKKKK